MFFKIKNVHFSINNWIDENEYCQAVFKTRITDGSLDESITYVLDFINEFLK